MASDGRPGDERGTGGVALDDLIGHAQGFEGVCIRAAGGCAWFTERVADRGLEYTPESTGLARLHTTRFIARVLERHSTTGFLRPGDHGDISKNAARLLALFASYLDDPSEATTSDASHLAALDAALARR